MNELEKENEMLREIIRSIYAIAVAPAFYPDQCLPAIALIHIQRVAKERTGISFDLDRKLSEDDWPSEIEE